MSQPFPEPTGPESESRSQSTLDASDSNIPEEAILNHTQMGTNVLGMLWLFIGVFPWAIAMATLELPRWIMWGVIIFFWVGSILLDLLCRFASEPADSWTRFFRSRSGGTLIWIPYWLCWPTTVAIIFLSIWIKSF